MTVTVITLDLSDVGDDEIEAVCADLADCGSTAVRLDFVMLGGTTLALTIEGDLSNQIVMLMLRYPASFTDDIGDEKVVD